MLGSSKSQVPTKSQQRSGKITDVGGFQDEAGEQEDDMPVLGSQEIQSFVGNNDADNNSEPEEGRERDNNHHLKDGDGTGDRGEIDGDRDGDGDLSNSDINDDDIMGDEAHSAPAGGDF